MDRALGLPQDQVGPALASLPEDQWFEEEVSPDGAPRDVAIPWVAMANADGGVLVVGLHGRARRGCPPHRRNELRQVALDFTHPPVRVRVQEVLAASAGGDPVTLVVFRIEPGDQVHTTQKGSCHLRVGDESQQLTAAQQRELVYDRGAAHYEATPVALSVEDLDQDQLVSYARAIGATSIEGMRAARDLFDRRGRLTVAAELLLRRPSATGASRMPWCASSGTGQTNGAWEGRMSLEDGEDVGAEGSLPRQDVVASDTIDQMMPKWRQLGPRGPVRGANPDSQGRLARRAGQRGRAPVPTA